MIELNHMYWKSAACGYILWQNNDQTGTCREISTTYWMYIGKPDQILGSCCEKHFDFLADKYGTDLMRLNRNEYVTAEVLEA